MNIAEIGLFPFLMHKIEFGKALLAAALEAAENDNAGLTISLCGCGYVGPYRAAAEGDARAIAIRDVITDWTCRTFSAPPQTVLCLLCDEPRQPPDRDIGVIVATYASVPMPSAICCSPVCMACWRRLPEHDNLMDALMERFRVFLPDLRLTHVPSSVRAH